MMNLDDYISKKEQEQKNREQWIRESTKWYTCFPEIDTFFPRTTKENQLLRDFSKYIRNYNFNTEIIKGAGNGNYVLAQIKTTNNQTMAALVERKKAIYTDYREETNPPKISGSLAYFLEPFLPNSLFTRGSHKISEEEYIRARIRKDNGDVIRELSTKNMSEEELKERLSQFQLIGSQEFFALSLGNLHEDWLSGYFPLLYAYYSKDGHVFMSKEMATHMTRGDLGNYLADQAIKIKQRKYPYNN